jgi:hypothetical protein
MDLHFFCKGHPLGIRWISIDLCILLQGVPLRNSLELHRLTPILRGVPLRNSSDFSAFASILQGVSLRIPSDFHGFHQIFNDFCKGCPIGIHRISIDLHLFCKGWPLRVQWIYPSFLQHPLSFSWSSRSLHRLVLRCSPDVLPGLQLELTRTHWYHLKKHSELESAWPCADKLIS